MATGSPPLFALRRELFSELAGKRLLYLDLLYWNHLCDVALGETDEPSRVALLTELRAGVRDGTVLCPVEYTVFVELYKQRLPAKRRATALLIDELSGGVVIVSPRERYFLEALRLTQALLAGAAPPPAPRDEVWTKPAFLLGHGELSSATMSPADLAKLNELVRAELWHKGFADVVGHLGENLQVSFAWAERVAAQLNKAKLDARNGAASYRDAYLAEARGVLEASSPALGEVIAYLFSRAGGDAATVSSQQQEIGEQGFVRLLAAAFARHDLSAALPSVHVPATLYASVRWDAPRRFRANDIQDFAHAAAALGYCDGFATERSLAALLRQSKLTASYRTTVLATVAEVRAWLST